MRVKKGKWAEKGRVRGTGMANEGEGESEEGMEGGR